MSFSNLPRGTRGRLSRHASNMLLGVAIVLGAANAALAVPLYFNSFGWQSVYRMDSTSGSGAATLIQPVSILNTTFLSITDAGPDNKIYGATGTDLWSIDVSGATAAWQKGVALTDTGSDGLAWSPTGQLYVAKLNVVRQVNPATGQTVANSSITLKIGSSNLSLGGMDFSPAGTLYASDSTHLYTINRSTGAATTIYSSPDISHGIFTDVDYGSDGILRALGSFNYVFSFNPQTANGTWGPKLTYNSTSFSPSSLASIGTGGSTHPWKNPNNALDVNNDGALTPLDAIVVINALNSSGSHALPVPPIAGSSPPPYIDTDGNDLLSALDALVVINALNAQSGAPKPSAEMGAIRDVPEPSSLGLGLLAASMLLLFGRRFAPSQATAAR